MRVLALGPGDVVQLGENQQILIAVQVAVGGDQLGHVADEPAHLGGLVDDVEAGHPGVPGGGGQQGGEHLDGGGLAGAVGAE